MTITRVRVPSRWQAIDRNYLVIDRNGVADFTLGVGPCGKEVVQLEVEYGQHALVIVQVCSCTERKVFVYPWHTVTGRIEVTYG